VIEDVFHLHMIGIDHFDPMIPPRLSSHLHTLADEHSSPPAFVGVEYAESVFMQLKAKRMRFRDLLQDVWPD
jgi:hypothetical protein